MFFIMGISQGQKKLNFDQLVVCRSCGKYGHLEVYMVYSYLSLFFIPVFRWGRSYYVRTTCCGRSVPISQELGRRIAAGEVTSLPEDIIPEGSGYGRGPGDAGYGSCSRNAGYGSLSESSGYGRETGRGGCDSQTREDPTAGQIPGGRKQCRVCGFQTDEDYQFCPKCGQRF